MTETIFPSTVRESAKRRNTFNMETTVLAMFDPCRTRRRGFARTLLSNYTLYGAFPGHYGIGRICPPISFICFSQAPRTCKVPGINALILPCEFRDLGFFKAQVKISALIAGTLRGVGTWSLRGIWGPRGPGTRGILKLNPAFDNLWVAFTYLVACNVAVKFHVGLVRPWKQ